MGEASRLHQVRDADAVQPPLAEEPACNVDDAVPVLGGPLLLTLIALFLVRKRRLTLYMMIDIYRQQ